MPADVTTNQTYRDLMGGSACTGVQGATSKAERFLSY